jgi:hypothetical protein
LANTHDKFHQNLQKKKIKIPNIKHKLTTNVSLHDPEITTFKKLKKNP